ncbi:hypothetical protein [Actinoallomurus iriomotensis]|uniref:Uncharacterized protein n=1 Tax=Actinoallomurus iriomotensis TaxID=478107 RepID=A0A9W6RMH7_9ACTN|nr:hypothetical protein [Actinoallomurus iriomotensis]GLY76727.1 hypothetical protein Airi01_049940 [Actinoallomurus iriomotensis]
MFRHRFDPSSLVAGLLFLTVAGRYLAEGLGGHPVSFPWAAPFVLGSIVLIVVLRMIFRSRRREQ